jgi:thioredoxin:protein disulfide reductase
MRKWLLGALLLGLLPGIALALMDDELLEPEKAFAVEASAADADTIRAVWTIADGYYMYRDKFRFESNTAGVTLGEPRIPRGTLTEDEFFGEVETFRDRIAIEIPIERGAGAPRSFELETVSQGCADLGVCYPPLTQVVKIDLPAPPAAAERPSSSGEGALAALSRLGSRIGLGGGGGSATPEFLDPEEAFRFTAASPDAETIHAGWDIADGYYLYRDKISFELVDADGVTLGTAELPAGVEKDDEFFGLQEVYYDGVQARIPVLGGEAAPAAVTLTAGYQGCAEAGICYPPMTKTVTLTLGGPPGSATAGAATTPASPTPSAPLFVSEQDRIANSLASGSTLLIVAMFFGFGLLLAFTPCVFPMIPILSSIIVGQGKGLTTRRAFGLSLVYVLAMALTYTVAGVLAGLFGANLQATFQNPWVLITFAGVFVLLSLAMFGFYELQMPSWVQSKLATVSNRQRGGTVAGVAVMGLLSALIVGPCVAAPLAGALIYIGQTGDAVLGGTALFAMSMGMGAPLLALGTSAGKLMPRVGPWMNAIKAVFGVLMLGVAIWLLERILPGPVILLMWAALLVISAIYMGALEPLGPDANGWRKLWKGCGLMMLIYGGALTVGAAGGAQDPFQPLRGINLIATDGSGAQSQRLAFQPVKGLEEVQQQIQLAASRGQPVMFDMYADWCVSCKEMERYTFSDPGVQRVLADALLIKADVTPWDREDQALARELGLFGPPGYLFFAPDGTERREYRVMGFMNAEEFRAHAEQALWQGQRQALSPM